MSPRGSLELFHAISDEGSARVRRFVVERGLEQAVTFRNVFYDEPAKALKERGGSAVPALWDGEQLFTGADAVIARLQAHLDVGRS